MRRTLLLGALPIAAAAQEAPGAWPSRSVRIVVPFAPGGGNDILARLYGQRLAARFGQNFVAENRPGAGGQVGTEQAIRARADGYTLVVNPSGPVLGAPGSDVPAYDQTRDLVPVALLATFPTFVLVGRDSPHRTLSGVLDWARANPGRATHGSGGITFQMWLGQVTARTGAAFEWVSYRGSIDAINAAAAGELTIALADPAPALAALESGRVRALAVTTSARMAQAPDVPTIAEAGLPGAETLGWIGLFAPAGTPEPIVARLADAVLEAARLPEIEERLRPLGMRPDAIGPREFGALVGTEARHWREVARTAGISLSR